MRPIATDTNDFPRLRREGCIYVDRKTDRNWNETYPIIHFEFDSRTRHFVDFAAVRYGGTETGTTETRRSEDA